MVSTIQLHMIIVFIEEIEISGCGLIRCTLLYVFHLFLEMYFCFVFMATFRRVIL